MNKTYIGIDNGVTGSIAIFQDDGKYFFYKTPVKLEQSYTKKKQKISRLDVIGFKCILDYIPDSRKSFRNTKVIIERPMINSTRFKSSMSAIRCLEATLIMLEYYNIAYEYCDSKQWQKVMLPKGCKKEELKKASIDIGCRLFPQFKDLIIKQKDADSLLIAEWARRKNL